MSLRRTVLAVLVCLLLVAGMASQAQQAFDRMAGLALQRYGQKAADTVTDWQAMLREATPLDDERKLQMVNNFFNRRIRFDDDINIWGEQDYWATPLETMGKLAGDCEDFSIAKYTSLKLLGVPTEKLRLIYVRAQLGAVGSGLTQAHMVVGYYATPESEPLVLDNLIADIRPASRRTDLYPVFSFNGDGLWVGGATASSADPTTRLSRWRDVVERMREEGLP